MSLYNGDLNFKNLNSSSNVFETKTKKVSLLLIFIIRMDNEKEKKIKEFYERLKAELDSNNSWPSIYLFKFIVPSEKEKILQVEEAFDCMGAVIKTTKSKTGKYTSISIDVMMKDSQAVIDKYNEVSTIEGLISL